MKLLVEVNVHEVPYSLHVLSPLQDIVASKIKLSKEQLFHVLLRDFFSLRVEQLLHLLINMNRGVLLIFKLVSGSINL